MPNNASITLQTKANLSAINQTQQAFIGLTQAQQKAEQEALKMAQAYARLDKALGNPAAGADRLRAALGNATVVTQKHGVAIQTQIAQLDSQAERLAKGTTLAQQFGGALQSQLLGMVGPAALATVAIGGIGKAIDAGNSAIALRETQNSLRAVAGSTQQYNQVLETARQQQRLFGGTLQENIEGLAGLTITARQSGANLKTLVDLSQRLTVLSPEQGTAGGRIALAEALSGNLTSLSRRFEIPKAKLQELSDTSLTTEQRLAALSRFLDSVGVTSEAVAGKVDKSALAYRALAAEADNAKVKIGGFLADAFAPAATTGANLLGIFQGTQEGFQGAAIGAQNFARQLSGLPPLTQQTEAAARGYFDQMIRGGQAVLEYIGLQDHATGITLRAADADDRAADAAFVHSEFVFRAADADDRIAASAQTAVAQMDRFIASLQASAEASVFDTQQKDAQQAATALVADKAKLAVDQFLVLNPAIDASAAASLAAAQGYEPEIQKLITLAIVARDAAAARQALNNGGPGGTVEDRKERDTPQQRAQAQAGGLKLVRDQRAKADQEARAAEEARRNQIVRTGSAADAVRVRQEQYNEAVRKFGKNSKEAIDAQTDLIEAQEKANKPKRGSASPGGKGLSTLDRTDIALAGDESARLAEINRRLEAGNLTELQRKQLLKEKLQLEEKIGDSILRQNEALVDAQLLTVRNQQERIKEDRELAAIARRRASPEFSAEQKNLDALREQEIVLERQKREIDIQDKTRAAGGVVPVVPSSGPVAAAAGGAPATLPVSSPTPPQGGQQKVGVFLDGKEVGFVLFPEFMAFLQGGAAQVRAAGG